MAIVGIPATDEFTLLANGSTLSKTRGAVASRVSTLQVCINQEILGSLPPGDHGAIISAYKYDRETGKKEAHPSFKIPVFISSQILLRWQRWI